MFSKLMRNDSEVSARQLNNECEAPSWRSSLFKKKKTYKMHNLSMRFVVGQGGMFLSILASRRWKQDDQKFKAITLDQPGTHAEAATKISVYAILTCSCPIRH